VEPAGGRAPASAQGGRVSSLGALLIALAASLAAGVCAFADGALLGVDPDDPPSDPALAALIRRRHPVHRALAFARVAMQLAAGAACAVAVYGVEGLATLPLLAMVLAGVALVVLSETTARDAGDRAGAKGLARTRLFVEFAERALAPVVLLGAWLDGGLARLIPAGDPTNEDVEASVEKFRHVVSTEADVGVRENTMLAGVFSLGDTTVAEVMTPRIDIIGVESDASWADVVARLRSSAHARLVVHDGTLDGVIGVLVAKDLLPHVVADEPPPGGWRTLVRPAAFIPASKRADVQLRDFRVGGGQLAIVADEFGGTAGLVTIEDLLELIVGEIQDERDTDEPEILQEDGMRYWVAGRLSLDMLSDAIGDDLRHDEVTTVSGLAYELFGRVPRAGESVDYRSWHLVIDRVRGRRIERVFLERQGVAVGAEDGV